jgi:phosphopentomutase
MSGSTRPSRAIVIVMDSVGVGELPDAERYGDAGSDTVGNIHRQVPLQVPTLRQLGLARVSTIGDPSPAPLGAYGRMAERSAGKDSVTGHWELTGIVLDRAFPTFPHGFPAQLMQAFERRIGRATIGNTVGSGTAIIDQLGPEHLRTGSPIVYTSADSVFQIAAHELVIPIDEQYRICQAAFDLAVAGLGVARVIARPFTGAPGQFVRTANRRDFAVAPRDRTLLDALKEAGHPVVAIGKIEDLFAGRGITHATHTVSDEDGMDVLADALTEDKGGLIFVNLVDFDTQYGHRNDVAGYAANLERFDRRLAGIIDQLTPHDMLVITADHGNDPSTPSTDHSREHVPVLLFGEAVRSGVDLGTRPTFADLGQTLADLFDVAPLGHGTSFLTDVLAID